MADTFKGIITADGKKKERLQEKELRRNTYQTKPYP